MLGTECGPGAGSAHTYAWVLEQGTEDSPADGVGVLGTEGGEGSSEKPGGGGRQGEDLVTREGTKSHLPFRTVLSRHPCFGGEATCLYLGSHWLPSGAQAVRNYRYKGLETEAHLSAPLPTPLLKTQRIPTAPGLLEPPVPTRSRKRLLASTEALLMLRAGVRPSRRLQSCRRPPSGSWGSCSWLHSDSIWVGDTKDSQLPRSRLQAQWATERGRQGREGGYAAQSRTDATVGGAGSR